MLNPISWGGRFQRQPREVGEQTGSMFQSTDAHMFSPMISNAMKPQINDAMPLNPR